MNESAKRFDQAMKAEEEMDSATEQFMVTAINLANEISKKGSSNITATEKKFLYSIAKFMISGIL